jgi:hypothetical protein
MPSALCGERILSGGKAKISWLNQFSGVATEILCEFPPVAFCLRGAVLLNSVNQ